MSRNQHGDTVVRFTERVFNYLGPKKTRTVEVRLTRDDGVELKLGEVDTEEP